MSEEMEEQAREKAMADAKACAEELARLAGVELGEVISVSEVVGGAHQGQPGMVELVKYLQEQRLAARIESGGRLVEQEHRGAHHQQRPQGDQLLLSDTESLRSALA